MTREEKLELYYRAKDAYYNGEGIMSDAEFDALEEELGLANKSSIGARHNPSYTVKHPYIMGSLSKVQVKEDENGTIEWDKYYNDVKSYVGNNELIITPKFDGCSWELHYTTPIDDSSKRTITISSRGDGTYGKDLYKHLIDKFPSELLEYVRTVAMHYSSSDFTLRGECLINKNIFEEKFKDKFVNPRSFVSGILNHEYDENDKDFLEAVKYLSIIIYDFRVNVNNEGYWKDLDWTMIAQPSFKNLFPDFYYILDNDFKFTNKNFITIYKDFETYREKYRYALDGIVFKPRDFKRKTNTTEPRPKDCVALKFVPMLTETVVTSIVWNLGKTHEWIPVINFNPIELDGKIITKCSGHNYGTLVSKKVSVGTKIIVRLAGDIIPDLYRVTDTSNYSVDKLNLPKNSHIDNDIHLMADLTENEKNKKAFIASATQLNIPTIGDKIAESIYDYCTKDNGETDAFFGDEPRKINNILLCSVEDIYFGSGEGKLGKNAQKAFKNTIDNITLTDIIKSCNFEKCGTKVAEQVARKFEGKSYDFAHLPEIAYSWCNDENTPQMTQLRTLLKHLGKTFNDFIQKAKINTENEKDERIPIIMTGEPNDYSSKGEFLSCHPEYRNTGSWKEVKIVFTNSLDSNTGKMKKAREKGIEIRLY